MARILVTGATGFVGRATVRRLLQDGHELRLAVRRPAAPGQVAVDLSQPVDWAPAVAGMDAVVHLAGLAHGRAAAADAAAFQAVNVDATAALGRAARAAGVRRLIHVSSVKAAGEHSSGRPLREADPPRPEDAYGRSKLEAERRLAALDGLEALSLRPPLVYGPGVTANFLALMRLVERGLPLPFGALHNRRSLVAVDNLADAIATAAAAPAVTPGAYFVSGQPALSTAELVRAIAAAMGRPARLLPVPATLLAAGRGLPVVGPRIARLTGDLEIDDGLFRQRFAWTPPLTVAQSLRATADWYRDRGAAAD